MTPTVDVSRYKFCKLQVDENERLFLDARKPFRYQAFADNQVHVVKDGETIWSIAGSHFRTIDRGAGLWWIIADFQPIPLHDPTIRLRAGTLLVLPSLRTVMTRILSEARRDESHL